MIGFLDGFAAFFAAGRFAAAFLGAALARFGAAAALLGTIVASPAAARTVFPATVTPPAGLTMAATVLLQGHARIGAWMAIDVRLKNDGPPISGELRLTGGTQGRTRFGTQVEAPTQSDQTHRLYVQPPGFGRDVEVSLVDGTTTIATTKATYSVHDGTQMIDLNTMLWNPGGWLLREGLAVNDAGQIAGEGYLNGVLHAFLLQPMKRPPVFVPCGVIVVGGALDSAR